MTKWRALIASGGLCLASLTGIIGDDMCSGDHKHMGGTDPVKCTSECVKEMGAKYALIVGSEVYALNDQAAAAKFAGMKVKVTGDVSKSGATKSVKVKSISAAK